MTTLTQAEIDAMDKIAHEFSEWWSEYWKDLCLPPGHMPQYLENFIIKIQDFIPKAIAALREQEVLIDDLLDQARNRAIAFANLQNIVAGVDKITYSNHHDIIKWQPLQTKGPEQ